ncbi:MAG: tRNA1(Val) (adenine(37)-N6)-methyltransferase, partial [Alphaproteobacteria bacterium]
LDSVLLAAAIPAKPGETVFEAGTGAGVAALCLAARCPEVRVEGLEVQPELAALARRNAQRNGLGERIQVETGSITESCPPEAANRFDHAMANPPFFDRAAATPPPAEAKARAHMAGRDELESWVRGLLARLRHKGSLSLVYPGAGLAGVLAALEGRAGDIIVFPLWPGGGRPAKRVIVSARKGSGAPLRLMPGLTLHEGGNFTDGAQAILRHGAALNLKS